MFLVVEIWWKMEGTGFEDLCTGRGVLNLMPLVDGDSSKCNHIEYEGYVELFDLVDSRDSIATGTKMAGRILLTVHSISPQMSEEAHPLYLWAVNSLHNIEVLNQLCKCSENPWLGIKQILEVAIQSYASSTVSNAELQVDETLRYYEIKRCSALNSLVIRYFCRKQRYFFANSIHSPLPTHIYLYYFCHS